jgi:hypothetical protein
MMDYGDWDLKVGAFGSGFVGSGWCGLAGEPDQALHIE